MPHVSNVSVRDYVNVVMLSSGELPRYHFTSAMFSAVGIYVDFLDNQFLEHRCITRAAATSCQLPAAKGGQAESQRSCSRDRKEADPGYVEDKGINLWMTVSPATIEDIGTDAGRGLFGMLGTKRHATNTHNV